MQRLKAVFKDINGLHSRIDTYSLSSSVLRVALIPLGSRKKTSNLLNALIDDPVQSTPWSTAVANRPLTKDTLVVQSSSFEFVETHNSLMVYPVPFTGPTLEYLEVNNIHDSWDHLKTCHLHLLLADSRFPGSKTEHPSLTIMKPGPNQSVDQTSDDVEYQGDVVWVDPELTLSANEKLQKSPHNASEFLKLRQSSGIDTLKATFDHDKVFEALKASIIRSCRSQIEELESSAESKAENSSSAAQYRMQWSRTAHEELQGSLLPRLRQGLYSDLAFYKLYARTDDVEAILSGILEKSLPESQAQYQFLMGKLSSGTRTSDRITRISSNINQSLLSETLGLQNRALKSVLTSTLGIQLPLIALSVAGLVAAGLDGLSMGALASLGIVAGLKKLQDDWVAAASRYEEIVKDKALDSIKEAETQLWETGERTLVESETRKTAMIDALRGFEEEK